MDIFISVSKDAQSLVASSEGIAQLPRITLYISRFGHLDRENDAVIIPLENRDPSEIFKRIESIFGVRLHCALHYSAEANHLLSQALDEAAKFTQFSDKARKIRDNENEQSDLLAFTKNLQRSSFARTLFPYQLLAAYHLAFAQNACNFSVPGAGKTSTVYASFSYLNNISDLKKHVDQLMIIGPLSAQLSWKADFSACFGRQPKVLAINGSSSEKLIDEQLSLSEPSFDYVIASYGSLHSRMELLKSFLRTHKTMVVLDEAHRIKNTDGGIQSQAVLELSPYAKSRVILTGTPAPNSYTDLYNLFKFIWPEHNIIGYTPMQLSNMSKHNDSRISDMVSRCEPFYIRVRKKDLNLPDPVYHEPSEIPMSPVQQQIYDAIAEYAIKKIENNSLPKSIRRSAAIRMRQASSNPALLRSSLDECYGQLDEDESTEPLDSSLDVSASVVQQIITYENNEIPNKFSYAGNLAARLINAGQKLLIWCEFVGTCEMLHDYLKSCNIQSAILFGATPLEKRETIVQSFDDPADTTFQVLIANPHAVGESISLHHGCHNALYLEQDFNAGTYMQSKDRIHRLGLLKNTDTHYYFVHSEGSCDQSVFERVLLKENRMLAMIDSKEIPLLSENADYSVDENDDFKAIIRDYYAAKKIL